MSPVSRARKRQPQPVTHSVTGLFKDVLNDFSALGAEPAPVDVELLASEVLGQFHDVPVEDGEESLGLELIAFAQRKITPGAAALLAALKVVAETDVERKAAEDGLQVVLGRGIPAPTWASELGRVRAGECWRTGDVYGDENSLLCVFSHGGEAYGLLALLDFTEGGRVRDLVVIEQPADVLGEMREQAEADPELVVFEAVEPAEAHRLIADGLAATDHLEDADVSEDYARFHAVALTWCRALPEPALVPEVAVWSETERAAVVEQFVAASGEDADAARSLGRLLLEHGLRTDPANPLRVGPEKIARFLEGLLGEEYELDADHEEAVEPVVLAWVQWTAERAGLTETAVAALDEAVADYLSEYADEDDSPLERYFGGVGDLSPSELADALERRMFAVPSLTTEIDDEEVDLDPTDPEQRRALVIAEADEDEEEQRLILRATIVDQLWDDEPADVWQTVERLQEGELDRDEIFEQLIDALEGSLVDGETLEYDPDAYVEALGEL
ncbi:hypothetical protein [Amycolatopsis sp. SID8362]|uniref:hypothetical protein n=1 Tax=Amycolatopsis sp. SID8362 TaxID=2690346 RepID=UPI0013706802|nr:hypothetical protein [Amycolatopsis sp. SID8362]NBH07987.1 hypothetical protein [Amycolatopsis sp. SID8362]NED44681.1 hypothetical protein [Amycolatopsis sp. SID8362]